MAGIQAVILASGFSRRLGVDKLSRVLCGKTVLQRVVENALGTGMGRIVVVIRERGQAAIVPKDKRISIIFNENADAGMSSSIKAAILKADPEFDSFLFMNGDMPFFSTGSINKLVELWKGNPEKMACIRHAGVLRGPVIFPRKYTDLLLSLEGESGGREILVKHRKEVVSLEIEDPDEVADIDSPQDLEHAMEICSRLEESEK